MQPREIRTCVKHGNTIFVKENNGQFRCMKCRIFYVSQNRIRLKQKLVDYFGGSCSICGYNKSIWALEFHHINPDEKKFGLGSGCTVSWQKALEETKKCKLVCANCHREIEHSEVSQ
jgi:hypothetical protein